MRAPLLRRFLLQRPLLPTLRNTLSSAASVQPDAEPLPTATQPQPKKRKQRRPRHPKSQDDVSNHLGPSAPSHLLAFPASPGRPSTEPPISTEYPIPQEQPPEEPKFPTPQNDLPPPSDPPKPTQPLIYPASPSPHHHDLASFLSYAERTSLDPSTTVYVGTHYEYTVQQSLARYGLALRRVGGASDLGIDLLGTWALPGQAQEQTQPPLRVLAQCKAVRAPGPHLIRELSGAFAGAPAGWRGTSGVVGVLVTDRAATKGMREALGTSRLPMVLMACSRQGEVFQLLYNRRADEEGLAGLGVAMRFSEDGGREVVLTWNGDVVPFVGG